MKLAGPVVVEDLREDTGMAVEEVLVEEGVIVSKSLGEAGESGGGDLLESRLVRLVSDAAHVQRHSVVEVAHGGVRGLILTLTSTLRCLWTSLDRYLMFMQPNYDPPSNHQNRPGSFCC